MLLNEFRGHLAIMGKRPYIWQIKEEDRGSSGAVLHQHNLVAVLFNDMFQQCVTIDFSG